MLGGTADMRRELASSTTLNDPERIQIFLESAQNTTSPVSYMLSFTVWDFVAGRFGIDPGVHIQKLTNNFDRLLATGYLDNGVGELVDCNELVFYFMASCSNS